MPSFSGHYADNKVDLEYASQSVAQRLDLAIPESAGASPLVILVHGGAWAGGDKGDFSSETVQTFVKAGYAVASVNYRLVDEGRFPAAVQDVKAAVRWLRANAKTYYLDPDRFAILGDSTGGYIAAAVGLTGDRQSTFDNPELGNAEESSVVSAAILWDAPTDFGAQDAQLTAQKCSELAALHGLPESADSTWLGEPVGEDGEIVRQANLLRYVGGVITPPVFQLVHGTADCAVPLAQSENFDVALKRANVSSRLVPVKGMKATTDKRFRPRLVQLAVTFLGTALR